jgi:hypothetical protein
MDGELISEEALHNKLPVSAGTGITTGELDNGKFLLQTTT